MITFPISNATIHFQMSMILSACYMSMLCTNWGNVSVFDNTVNFFSNGNGSFWFKIVAEWFSIVIYLFSLIAPMLFPNRNFDTKV